MIEKLIDQLMAALPKEVFQLISNSNLDGTLDGEFANQFQEMTRNLLEVNDTFGINLPIATIIAAGNPSKDYASFPTDALSEFIAKIESQTKAYDDRLVEMQKIAKAVYTTEASDYLKLFKSLKKEGIRIDPGDTVADFRRKNRHLGNTDTIRGGKIAHLISVMEEYATLKKAYDKFVDKTNHSRSLLQENQDVMRTARTTLHIIEELRQHPEIEKEEADRHLMALLRGEVKAGTARKAIYKHKTQQSTPVQPTTFSTQSLSQNQEGRLEQQVRSTEYDPSELSFLEEHGIRNSQARHLLERRDYPEIKEFIQSIEAVFKNRDLDIKEAATIFQKHPALLLIPRREALRYVESLDALYDLHNPRVASGVLPRHSPALYSSLQALTEYLESKSNVKAQVELAGLEKITNASDQQLFLRKINLTPFTGEPIKKYIGGPSGKKTMMYQTYSDIAGEGHYRKLPFGNQRRAVFKVTNDGEGKYQVSIIEYFDNHAAYDRFYNRTRI